MKYWQKKLKDFCQIYPCLILHIFYNILLLFIVKSLYRLYKINTQGNSFFISVFFLKAPFFLHELSKRVSAFF